MKKLLLLLISALPIFATNVITAASCSQANVTTAITSATNGTVVVVPGPCSVTWSALTIPNTKGITLTGGGSVTVAGSNAVVVNQNASVGSRVTGFTFTGIGNSNDGDVECNGSPTSAACRIDHNTFVNAGLSVFVAFNGSAPALLDHNKMTGGAASEMVHVLAYGDPSTAGWANDVTPGSANMVFIEDNQFINSDTSAICSAVESVYGALTVFRYNSLFFCQVDQHGTAGIVGARWWEFYENTFNAGGLNYCCYADLRGGSGVFFNNHVTGAPPLSPPATVTLREEDAGYPALYQIGRGYLQDYSPVYIWNNDATMSIVSGSANVQLNRDYFVSSNQPGSMLRCESAADGGTTGGSTCPTTYNYVPYTYPHPLTVNWTTWTVCKSGSGCDFTTVNGGIQNVAVSCGDYVELKVGLGDGTGANGAPSGWFRGGDGLSSNNPVVHTKACTNNPLVLTSDQQARLPNSTTRITPAYADGATPVVPTIYNPAAGMLLYLQPGNGGTPGSGLTLLGLQFCCWSGNSDWIGFGTRGQGTADPALNVVGDIPTDVLMDRVIVRVDPTVRNTRKAINFDAIRTTIQNSWIEGGWDENQQDSQTINGGMGTGSVLNNLISGTTEVMNMAEDLPPVFTPIGVKGNAAGYYTVLTAQAGNMTAKWNEVTKPVQWMYTKNWAFSSPTRIPKGKIIKNSMGSGTPIMQAQNAGTACTTEPTWPASNGGSITDCGGITWLRIDIQAPGKNLSECKTVDSWTLSDNFFHFVWPQGQQGYAFTFTSSPNYRSVAHCNGIVVSNNYVKDIGTQLNNSGMDLANDVNVITGTMTSNGPWTITTGTNDKLDFTVNGTHVGPVTLPGGSLSAATLVSTLNTAFTAGPGFACIDGAGAVIIRARLTSDAGNACTTNNGSYTISNTSLVINSTTHDAATTLGLTEATTFRPCQNPRNNTWYGCGLVNGLTITNNIFANVNTGDYFSGVAYQYPVFQHEENISITHNTNLTTRVNPAATITTGVDPQTQAYPAFNLIVNNNIFGWISGEFAGMTNYWNNGSTTDFTAINYYACQPSFVDSATASPADPVCPANISAGNVFPNSNLAATTTLTTTVTNNGGPGFGKYPSNNFNNTTASLLLDPSTYALGITLHGTDGLQTGADVTQIPRILSPSISTTPTTATLTYTTTSPVAGSGFGCVIYVTTKDSFAFNAAKTYDTPDYAPVIADMDPSIFTNPEWDNNNAGTSHSITIGSHSALTPSTTYFLRLMCPGATWPEDGTSATFTTAASAAGGSVRSGKTLFSGKTVIH